VPLFKAPRRFVFVSWLFHRIAKMKGGSTTRAEMSRNANRARVMR
jgi:hypothetical protein